MYEALHSAVATIQRFVASIDLNGASGPEAVELFDILTQAERVVAAGRTLVIRRIEETNAWYGSQHPSPAKWIASRAQTTIGSAVATMETARRLDSLPSTRAAFVSGELSAQQTQEIAAAAWVDPSAELSLLDEAQKSSVNGLRNECRRVIAAATPDDGADERIFRSRYLRTWTDADGSFRLDARMTQDMGARMMAPVKVLGRDFFEAARAAGARQSRASSDADALVAIIAEGAHAPKSVVNVLVDYEALKRGRISGDERCEIPGIGTISVAAAQRLSEDAIVRAVLAEGADVRAIATVGRPIPAPVRKAVEARDTTCPIRWCDEVEKREFHHRIPVSEGGLSTVENVVLPCRHHHKLVTHFGWSLEGCHGDWVLVPPGMKTAPDERAPPKA